MSLRTRIALTFLVLLTAVLTAALSAAWIAGRGNAEVAVRQRLVSNRQLLTQAAQAVAYDSGFRDAVSDQDTETLVTVLENSGTRVDASMAVLTSMDGTVIAAFGSRAAAGTRFPIDALHRVGSSGTELPNVMIDGTRIYQVVAVTVKSPLPVAIIAMGFDLGEGETGLERIRGQEVSLIKHADGRWRNVVTRDPVNALPGIGINLKALPASGSPRPMSTAAGSDVSLAKSLADANAPFDQLNALLLYIAAVSVIVFAWAAFWIARHITRPLGDLTRSVDKIRDGTYDVPLTVSRPDELGVLAEGLQLMREAVMSRDISIRRLAYEDALTGLMNRTAFSASLTQTLLEAGGARIGVAIINLHRFRRINEHLGYSVGDAVLSRTAARLAAVPSVDSAVARLAADEFAAFTRLSDGETVQSWGASLLTALSEPVVVEAQPIDVSATVGLAVSASGSMPADELLRCADLALEQARREKRPIGVYEEASGPQARDQLSLLGELRRALERDELRLYFQPKIELATGRIAGAEVLLRWQHPTRGLLGPATFIPFAEQTGPWRRARSGIAPAAPSASR
jgi:diguanylate cyclase (GGDEF)-like protein